MRSYLISLRKMPEVMCGQYVNELEIIWNKALSVTVAKICKTISGTQHSKDKIIQYQESEWTHLPRPPQPFPPHTNSNIKSTRQGHFTNPNLYLTSWKTMLYIIRMAYLLQSKNRYKTQNHILLPIRSQWYMLLLSSPLLHNEIIDKANFIVSSLMFRSTSLSPECPEWSEWIKLDTECTVSNFISDCSLLLVLSKELIIILLYILFCLPL